MIVVSIGLVQNKSSGCVGSGSCKGLITSIYLTKFSKQVLKKETVPALLIFPISSNASFALPNKNSFPGKTYA